MGSPTVLPLTILKTLPVPANGSHSSERSTTDLEGQLQASFDKIPASLKWAVNLPAAPRRKSTA